MIGKLIGVVFALLILLAIPFLNLGSSFTVSGVVVKTESFWGGCQHTDFCNVYFEDGNTQWFNPSLEIVENLELNKFYTFNLRYDNNSDGTVIWCEEIIDENGIKVYDW